MLAGFHLIAYFSKVNHDSVEDIVGQHCSKSTTETLQKREICSKLTLKTSERRH